MELISGARALALGALDAGVTLVTCYPGAPVTSVVNHLLALSTPDRVQVEWTSNEKVAAEMAIGASLGGVRALVCVKSVGLNLALDPLMVVNLSGCNAGLVILVGDDPGGWGSQNEQDSRAVARATGLPIIEPASIADARSAMLLAYRLSQEVGLPVVVRVTRALTLAEALLASWVEDGMETPLGFQHEFMRWVVLPINVVPNHHRLLERIEVVRAQFETSVLNQVWGDGDRGVIAAGFVAQKLTNLFGETHPDLRILNLGTFHPSPTDRITAYLRSVKQVLVLEETAPLVEREIRNLAQRAGLVLPIYGRDSGHVPGTGELFASHLAASLNSCFPALALDEKGDRGRPMPSRETPTEDCPYIPIFDTLQEALAQMGTREDSIVVGDPGCMVRFQDAYGLMDVKMGLGSSIGMASGISMSLMKSGEGKQVVAISGDSSFTHSNFNGLVDAVRVGASILVLILDNQTTALSGGQPNPASGVSARGEPRQAVDLRALALESGAGVVEVVDIKRGNDLMHALEKGLRSTGVRVIIAQGRCPGCP
jgi:indolepyruvate ferredoxin oxidoreductase alpha subunit